MIKKLRTKFVCILMTVVTIMLVVMFGLVIHFTGSSMENQSIQMMQAIASEPFQLGLPDDRTGDIRLPYFVVQVSRWGEVTATGGGYYDLSDEETILAITKAALESEEQTGVLKAYKLRYSKNARPSGQIIVFVDMSSEQATMNGLIQSCIFIGIISFAAFLSISLLLARWAVKPVDQAWQQQKQFVADASHELKTPLTVIMTNAELLQSPDCDESARRQFSDSILVMSRQMRGLVEGLLELTRVDNGAVKTKYAALDFSDLVQNSVLPFEPLYFEKGLILETGVEAGVWLKGSESHLHQVLDILLDNAMKYTTPGGTVRVAMRHQGSHALLSVAGPGEAISPEDQKNIFKRFYRIDKARSRDGSYGLGLSIAQSIVTEHGGRIWADSRDGINTFLVQLPLN